MFANHDLDMRNIRTYGFNYDYTLAMYSKELHCTLYRMATSFLISEYDYPSGIRYYDYDGSFPIRGLHFDTKTGCLMKISASNHVQLGSVYRGYKKVSDEEVLREYGSYGQSEKVSGKNWSSIRFHFWPYRPNAFFL